MNKKFCISIFFLLFLSGHVCFASEESTICYAPYWGGILPGESTQKEAIKLYGKGLFKELGYERVRYYINKLKTHSLEIHFATDDFVTDLIVQEGIFLPEGIPKTDLSKYISDWFVPEEGFGLWHKLRIGMLKGDAFLYVGKPHEVISEDHWRYFSKCSCELPSGIDLNFRNGRIVKVRFWASQG